MKSEVIPLLAEQNLTADTVPGALRAYLGGNARLLTMLNSPDSREHSTSYKASSAPRRISRARRPLFEIMMKHGIYVESSLQVILTIFTKY